MKPSPADLRQALARLDSGFRAVIAFGPDAALVRERALACARQVADPADPFQTVELTATQVSGDPARLADEAAALAFLGGRKVVRIEAAHAAAAAEGLVEPLKAMLDQKAATNLVVITAGDLSKASKLRQLAESAPTVLAIACYPEDGRAIEALLQDHAASLGVRLTREAAQAIAAGAGAERDVGRREVEKLATYAGLGKTGDGSATEPGAGRPVAVEITLADVEAVGAGLGAGAFDRMIHAVFAGQAGLAQEQIENLYAEGESGIALLRMCHRRAWQLLQVRLAMAEGLSAADAVGRLRPPVFWKDRDSLAQQARAWPIERLTRALDQLLATEIAAKSGGLDGELLCAQALLALSISS